MKKEDILANCIDEIQAGKCTLEDCLARYPHLSSELRPLLKVATSIQPEKATPSPEFKQRARNRLLEAMQPPQAGAERRGLGIGNWLKPLVPARVPSFPLTIAIVILVLLAAGSTTVYASQGSLPGDALYPIKTGAETIQLALTLSPEARANLHLKLAQRRTEEIIAQSNQGLDISTSALEAVATQIDAAIRETGNMLPEDTKAFLSQLSESTLNQQVTLVRVLEEASEATQPALRQARDATRRGNLIAQVAYGNSASLNSSPSVLDEELEAAYFELEGTLLSAEGSIWNIGGLLLENVNSPQGAPPIGSRVKIKGLVQGDQIFISKIKHKEKIENKVKIKGIFGGASSDGTIWYVGGIPVSKPQNLMPPPQGNQLELEGTIQEGVFTVTKMETEEDEAGKVEISGVLAQVHPGEGIVVIEVAGAQVSINIRDAIIKSEDGQPLTLSDLESLAGNGKDIQVHGLYEKDGLFFAKEVYVDMEQEQEPTDKEREQDKSKKRVEDED